MRKLEPTGRFKRDYKLLQKQQIFDREAFDYVINQLANDIPLEEKYRSPLGRKVGNISSPGVLMGAPAFSM